MILVGVINDKPRVKPWINGMEEYLPEGTLVIVSSKASASGNLRVECSDQGLELGFTAAWYVHPSNVDIIGEL